MGRNKLTIKNSAHHSHFTWRERIQLQYYHTGSNGFPRICEKTLYNYIQAGYMGTLTEQDLLYGGKRRKAKGEPK